jgi:alpha-glucosidase (family GH31 glycosyl hydrolase)
MLYLLGAPLDLLPLHVKGGVIFPLQEEAINTQISRNNPWRLLVALDDTQSANGDVFVDDGISKNTVESRVYFLVRGRGK